MAVFDSEKVQEIFLILGDNFSRINKFWLFIFIGLAILVFPVYLGAKVLFTNMMVASYKTPKIVYAPLNFEPLQILDKQILQVNDQSYVGLIKIKNSNLEAGVAQQSFAVSFISSGNSTVHSVTGTTFILPASEKLIVIPRFFTDKKPEFLDFRLDETSFNFKPVTPRISTEIQRITYHETNNEFVVSAVIKNQTPFLIKQIELPVMLYDKEGKVLAANYTNINDLEAYEARSFQFFWPTLYKNVGRAEINPEINIFDRGILESIEQRQTFDDRLNDEN